MLETWAASTTSEDVERFRQEYVEDAEGVLRYVIDNVRRNPAPPR